MLASAGTPTSNELYQKITELQVVENHIGECRESDKGPRRRQEYRSDSDEEERRPHSGSLIVRCIREREQEIEAKARGPEVYCIKRAW